MCAQRRTAVKRDPAAAAPAVPPRRASEGRKAASAVGPERPSKSPVTKGKAVESKPHPLTARIDRAKRLYRDTRAEMTKITWPDKETTRNLTIVVIGISFVLGVLLGGIDFVFLELLEAMS
ncbi:MAG: preprotein translocase subunit SecE [Thermomicrobiales bacterium]